MKVALHFIIQITGFSMESGEIPKNWKKLHRPLNFFHQLDIKIAFSIFCWIINLSIISKNCNLTCVPFELYSTTSCAIILGFFFGWQVRPAEFTQTPEIKLSLAKTSLPVYSFLMYKLVAIYKLNNIGNVSSRISISPFMFYYVYLFFFKSSVLHQTYKLQTLSIQHLQRIILISKTGQDIRHIWKPRKNQNKCEQ